MLVIHNVDTLDKIKSNVVKRKSKKTQILLYDTNRRIDDFISKLKFRKNGKYEDIPHFIVSKLGLVYQVFDTNHYSKTFDDSKLDKRFIKIAIENLGWLTKNTITGILYNWIDDPYRSTPATSNWRNHFFWDKYEETQMESLVELCKKITEEHNIPYNIVPTQECIKNTHNFHGIVCKSNFSNIYTDINPSFNFKTFYVNTEENKKQL
jgi:hypothetical protein